MSTVVQDAAERLSNALRIYFEVRIQSAAISREDIGEAVDNVDRAFDSILAGMHSLYDAMGSKKILGNWWEHGDTAACLLIRNARHHNATPYFSSWNKSMLKDGRIATMSGAAFLLVGYAALDSSSHVAEYYVPFFDFQDRLSQDKKSHIKDPGALVRLFDAALAFQVIRAKALKERYPNNQVFVNMMPVVVQASTRVFSWLKTSGIEPSGFDSRVYASHFADSKYFDMASPTFRMLRLP